MPLRRWPGTFITSATRSHCSTVWLATTLHGWPRVCVCVSAGRRLGRRLYEVLHNRSCSAFHLHNHQLWISEAHHHHRAHLLPALNLPTLPRARTRTCHRWFGEGEEVKESAWLPSLSRKERLLAFVALSCLSVICFGLVSPSPSLAHSRHHQHCANHHRVGVLSSLLVKAAHSHKRSRCSYTAAML
jgi:hypothetical protein